MNKNFVLCFILSISIFMLYNSENKQMGGDTNLTTTHPEWLKHKNKQKYSNLKYYLQIAGVFIIIGIAIYFLNKFLNTKRIRDPGEPKPGEESPVQRARRIHNDATEARSEISAPVEDELMSRFRSYMYASTTQPTGEAATAEAGGEEEEKEPAKLLEGLQREVVSEVKTEAIAALETEINKLKADAYFDKVIYEDKIARLEDEIDTGIKALKLSKSFL